VFWALSWATYLDQAGNKFVWVIFAKILSHPIISSSGALAWNLLMATVSVWSLERGGVPGLSEWIRNARSKEREAALAKLRDGIESEGKADKARFAIALSTGAAESYSLDAWERRQMRALSLTKPSFIVMWICFVGMGLSTAAEEPTAFKISAGIWMASAFVLAVAIGFLWAASHEYGPPPKTDSKATKEVAVAPVPAPAATAAPVVSAPAVTGSATATDVVTKPAPNVRVDAKPEVTASAEPDPAPDPVVSTKARRGESDVD
jgi:hypothetical protein